MKPVEQSAKAREFRALHQRPGIFVMPNAWDAGSARLLAAAGFAGVPVSAPGARGGRSRIEGRSNAVVSHYISCPSHTCLG